MRWTGAGPGHMTQNECTAILAALAVTLRTELDAPTFRAYARALDNIPASLFQAAADRAARTPRRDYDPVFPTAPMLRQYAEDARLEIARAHPYEGCCECDQQIGWRPIVGSSAVERCPCHTRHQATLARLGVGGAALALPVGEGAHDRD